MSNRLEIIRPDDLRQMERERIIIYGRAGIGKSRLALSLPSEKYGKIAYYAADKNSEFLQSISRTKRDRIYAIKPVGDDPTALFMQYCMTDWGKVDPEIKTLVVDTYTKVALDSISFSANSQSMTNERHYIVGTPGEGGTVIPNRGDYQAIEALSRAFLDMLFTRQSDKHIIFCCHEDVKVVEGVEAVGGPAHPGRAMTEYLPAQFSTVIRLIREQVLLPGADAPNDVVIAVTENDGKFIAKMRIEDEDQPNPLARVVLDRNPVNFWNVYDNWSAKTVEGVA